MKSNIKVLIRVCIFFLCLGALTFFLYRVFKWKTTVDNYFSSVDAYSALEKDTVDVLITGPSYAYCSVNPAILWDEQGISAFNYAVSSQDKTANLYLLKDALKTQSPKVVMVDYTECLYDGYGMESNLYRNTITTPNSINNSKLIFKIMNDRAEQDKISAWDLLLRWPVVHSRYKELSANDFVQNVEARNSMGYLFCDGTFEWNQDEALTALDKVAEISSANKDWVDELVLLSKENGFELVFFYTEVYMTAEEQVCKNSFEKYLEDNSIRYINMADTEEFGIDRSTDYQDYGHMNYVGASHVSKYLSQYLATEFTLANHRGDERFTAWDTCSEYYARRLAEENINGDSSPKEVLSWALSKDNMIIVASLECDYMANDTDAGSIFSLLNLGDEAWMDCGTWIIRDSKLAKSFPNISDDEYFTKINSGANTFAVKREQNGTIWQARVYMDDVAINRYQDYNPGMFLFIYDDLTGRVVYNGYIL